MLILVIILSVLLSASIVGNVIFYRAAERQLIITEIYEEWISNFRDQALKTWAHMKMLDDKQMFEKDDDVGILFQDIKSIIQDLNDKTEELSEQEEE